MKYELLAPAYRDVGGHEHILEEQGNDAYADGRVSVCLKTEPVDGDAVRIRHIWRVEETISIQPVIRIRDTFRYDSYIIPCVSIHGNRWGAGNEPKGLVCGDKPWVFDVRRTGIPGCTLTENAEAYCALMAGDDSEASLTAACSMIDDGGFMEHRMLYPDIEEPKTYSERDGYSEAHEPYIVLNPGETFEASVMVLYGKPAQPNFAMINVQNAAQKVFLKKYECPVSDEEIWNLSIRFAETLFIRWDDVELFGIGHRLRLEGAERPRCSEFGWCGQNGMLSRMMMLNAKKRGDDRQLEKAIACMDAWAEAVHPATGLPWVAYEWKGREDATSDTCNISYYISEMLRCWQTLRDMGIDRPAYLRAALQAADFMADHVSDEHGFGKVWRVATGECVETGGTIGCMLTASMVAAYTHTGDRRYLEAAEKAFVLYAQRDLVKFECTAGALDTCCIDKETSYGFILGGLALHEATGKREYLEYAVLGAEYFSSWMYYYDIPCGPDSDFAKYGFHTTGMTAVSAQHHHLDPWGVLLVPCYIRLAQLTGDKKWQDRADVMWAGGVQLITREDGEMVHGMPRPAGAQNEACFQCHWWSRHEYAKQPGDINDWLVAWPAAFRMYTIAELEEMKK